MKVLDKTYNAAEVEEAWYARWLEAKAFHADVEHGGEPYTIVIPPPNVTGILHMGHALNNTIQDVLVRWRRMQGRNALWVPGTDHAGIATQNVVERSLREEGLTRDKLGREAFISRVWQWREKYGNTIIHQLKKLGASCDWDRERFTMDEGLSDAVAEVFIRLYNKKLVYRGNYIINWCPRCKTALSDEESEHKEHAGKLYYLRYPVKDNPRKHVVVATTRPETMLGDVAVAVNPRDERYSALVGKKLVLPLLNRVLDIIADDFVDPQFGTGAVKVTPAHDPNDFAIANRHGLQPINVMNDDGTMNEQAGQYRGLDRFECRKRVLEDIADLRLVEKVEDHANAVGHCYRCDTIVEPRLSLQWFVRMKPLARPAVEAVKDGRIKFVPERWTKVYLDWMENIRDWCISRQIWWGHRIPVFYCDDCKQEWVDKKPSAACPSCASTHIRQDTDVLDTWFSSWLWPFSTLGWPAATPELKRYYPTDSLVTAPEIIFFWVARMIVSGLEFMGDIPFKNVYIHGTVRDDKGRKMSKSLGNSIDPLDVIRDTSADALRFSLMMVAAMGQDIHLSSEKFEIGRNFLTKIWNAARFMQMHSGDGAGEFHAPDFNPALLGNDDRHLLYSLHERVASVTENLEFFRFGDAARDLYDFVWHQFCDWYIEYAKTALNGEDAARKAEVLKVMHYAFATSLKLLHPFIPFQTEELWHAMGYGKPDDLIMLSAWPTQKDFERWPDIVGAAQVAAYVEQKHELIRIGRMLRADYGLPPSKKIAYTIKPVSEENAQQLALDRNSIASLLRAGELTIDAKFEPGKAMPNGMSRIGAIFMPIDGLIDVQAELRKLDAQLQAAADDMATINRKLNNVSFIQKAPEDVIQIQRTRRQEALEKSEKLRRLIEMLTATGG